jgi:hypothetical protein
MSRQPIEQGVTLVSVGGEPTHVEIDLNRVHIYDGNGLALEPAMIRGAAMSPTVLQVQVGALARLARFVEMAQRVSPEPGEASEWHVESIGGGMHGTREEALTWLRGWRREYADRYEIHVRRRRPAGPWRPSTTDELENDQPVRRG